MCHCVISRTRADSARRRADFYLFYVAFVKKNRFYFELGGYTFGTREELLC